MSVLGPDGDTVRALEVDAPAPEPAAAEEALRTELESRELLERVEVLALVR